MKNTDPIIQALENAMLINIDSNIEKFDFNSTIHLRKKNENRPKKSY